MVQRITLAPQGPEFSRFVMGYWRLMDWNMSPVQLEDFIEEHLDLGITTVDHADIYGGYQCEAAFGEALKRAPALRERMEIVTKCGIATTAKPEHALGHCITDSAHIVKSAAVTGQPGHRSYRPAADPPSRSIDGCGRGCGSVPDATPERQSASFWRV
ncbi:hypothetical protein FJMB80003_19620 [Enterobacter hormaechei]|nr:hypothetical protein FJMB80003_19620 [Enterobacter hormaechei]